MSDTLKAASDKFWFSRGQWFNPVGWDTPENYARSLAATAFEAGARWNMLATSAASPYINEFLHMCVLLGIWDETKADAVAAALWGAPGDVTPRETTPGYCAEPPY